MGFDDGGYHIAAAFQPPVRLAEHGVGLADSWRGAQVDPQMPALHSSIMARGARTARMGRTRTTRSCRRPIMRMSSAQQRKPNTTATVTADTRISFHNLCTGRGDPTGR